MEGLKDERVGNAKTGRGFVNSVNRTRQCREFGQAGHIAVIAKTKLPRKVLGGRRALGNV